MTIPVIRVHKGDYPTTEDKYSLRDGEELEISNRGKTVRIVSDGENATIENWGNKPTRKATEGLYSVEDGYFIVNLEGE